MASLTIGVGELIFSTRAGALFRFDLLWFFAAALFFKWCFTFATARQFALTGAHPFEAWMRLPGPRGWLPATFLGLAFVSFPIWVAFHSGTMGTLLVKHAPIPAAMAVLVLVTALAWIGGYKLLERAQVTIVAIMLASVLIAFFMLAPDWMQLLTGFVPKAVAYPNWATTIPELKGRAVWVEVVTYVGVIGGSGYDYLAYVSYLREKKWRGEEGVRNAFWDSIVSFVAVLLFTIVFTAFGAVILNPQQVIPAGNDLLTLQAQFLPALKPLYFAGAALAVFGTLYGTIEVAPAIWRETLLAFGFKRVSRKPAIAWVCGVAFAVLCVMLFFGNTPALIAILTPANLFTGVLASGIIALLAVWTDRKPRWLALLNVIGGLGFAALGIRGYMAYGSVLVIPITLGVGLIAWVALARPQFNVQPLILRELRAEARRPNTYWVRALAAAAITILFAWATVTFRGHPNLLGPHLFGSLSNAFISAVLIVVSALTSDSISREKREGTLGLLFLTPLTNYELVIGKALIHLLRAVPIIMAILPIVGLPFLVGGISTASLFSLGADLVRAILIAIAAGIFSSVRNTSWIQSIVWAEIAAAIGYGFTSLFPEVPGIFVAAILLWCAIADAGLKIKIFAESASEKPPGWIRMFSNSEFWRAAFHWDARKARDQNPHRLASGIQLDLAPHQVGLVHSPLRRPGPDAFPTPTLR